MKMKLTVSLDELKEAALNRFRKVIPDVSRDDIKPEYSGEYDSREFVGFTVELDKD